MIRFVLGKPGGGKSLFAVSLVVDVLRSSSLTVATNLALRLDPWIDGGGVPRRGLLAYLEKRFGETFDARERIQILKPEEVRGFFLERVRWVSDEQRWVKDNVEVTDQRFVSSGRAGRCYIIDEAHEYFPGSAIASKAEGQEGEVVSNRLVLSWASQNRRMGDDVWLLSQVAMNVLKPLRAVAQECVVLTNHRHLSSGPWRQPDVISARVYQTVPPGDGEQWLRRYAVRCDRKELIGCYDTASGAGVSGQSADIGQRASGLHWSTIPVGVLAALLLMLMAFRGCRSVIGKALSQSSPVGSDIVAVSNAAEWKKPSGRIAGGADKTRPEGTSSEKNGVPEQNLAFGRLTGITWTAGVGRCYFESGDVFSVGDRRVQGMGLDWVVIDRYVYRLRFAPPPVVAAERKPPAPPLPSTSGGGARNL